MDNSNGYIVKDFSKDTDISHIMFYNTEKEMYNYLQTIDPEKIKFCIYKVGDCLLDWS